MSFNFQIRPIGSAEQGFQLSCEGVFPDEVHHDRLIEAVIHAVQVGSRLPGEIQVFDCEGQVAEVLPLCFQNSVEPKIALSRAA
jgi:hypothetical protein